MSTFYSFFGLIDAAWCTQIFLLGMTWAIFSVKKLQLKTVMLYTAILGLILGAVYAVLFTAISTIGSLFPILWSVSHGAVSLVFAWLVSPMKPKNRLLLWIAIYNVLLSVAGLSGQCGLLLSRATESSIIIGGVRSGLYLLMPLAAFFLRKLNFDNFPAIPGSCLLLVGILLLCEYALSVTETVFYDFSGTSCFIFAISYSCMLCCDIVSVQALHTICSEQQKVYRLTSEKQRFLAEREITAMAETSLEDLRCIRHDLKNQYGYLQILVEQERYSELKEYLQGMQEHLPAQLSIIDCGNRVVNTVLNMEFSKLRSKGITFTHSLVVPPALPFREEDICSLLSNLLDNALDECSRLQANGRQDVSVELEIHPHSSYLLIRCLNSTDRTELHRRGLALSTTKSEKEIHGFGTRIISKLSEKYNGCNEFRLEDGMFVAQVMLDMTGGENNEA